jgi:NAD(P)-dependent dehydrogenase (short-subunit alcohol dehydrogenase family)
MKNKCLLITGGTGKIGSQLVKHFYKKNFDVIFTSKKQNEIDSLKKNIKPSNVDNKLIGITIDLEKENFSKNILQTLEAKNLNPISIIHCARSLTYLKIGPNGVTKRNEWLGEFTLGIITPYELSMSLAQQKNSHLKKIINIGSMYGVVPANPSLYNNPKQESPIQYGVVKAALIHLTKELAIRLAPYNIQVNTVSYGGVEGRVSEEFKKKYSKLCPSSRMLNDNEVIGAIDFLISDFSSGITGHNLIVDGGWSVW